VTPAAALRAIIRARDHHAEHAEYPPDTVRTDQGFDDWAADLAAQALKGAGTGHRLKLAAHAALDARASRVLDCEVLNVHSVLRRIDGDDVRYYDAALVWRRPRLRGVEHGTHRAEVALLPDGSVLGKPTLYGGHYGLPLERVLLDYANRCKDVDVLRPADG